METYHGQSKLLNGWKEIATYLGRGVRTVQRWEAELNLPVRRPRPGDRTPVIAFSRELDEWLRGTRQGRPDQPNEALATHLGALDEGQYNAAALIAATSILQQHSQRLMKATEELRRTISKMRNTPSTAASSSSASRNDGDQRFRSVRSTQ